MTEKKVIDITKHVEADTTVDEKSEIFSLDAFLAQMPIMESDIKRKFDIDITKNMDDVYFMLQYHLDELPDGNAGNLFFTGANVAELTGDNDTQLGLIVLRAMSIDKFNDILEGKEQTMQVLGYPGLKTIVEQVAEKMDPRNVQILVEYNGKEIDIKQVQGGNIDIDGDELNVAVPQGMTYINKTDVMPNGETQPDILYLQI